MDHYAVLGLAPGAPTALVKARFRHLAMAVHPDRNADDLGCQERLKHINAAYEFLSDATRKSQYDARYPGPLPLPATSVPVRAASSIPRAAHLLTAAVACAFCAGAVVAAVTLVESAQSADGPTPAPVMTIIELPSEGGQIPPPRESGMAFGLPPAAAPPAAPAQIGALWPGDLSGPSLSGPSLSGPSLSGPSAAPVVSGGVPVGPGRPLSAPDAVPADTFLDN